MRSERMLKKAINCLLTAAILFTPLFWTGCFLASPPSGGEFQKETAPAKKKEATTTNEAPLAPGKTVGYEIYENKDPFTPLIGAAGAPKTIVTTTTTDATGVVTSSSAAVKLLTIPLGNSAAIEVNGTLHEGLKAGDTFANNFRLISLGTGSVVIQYGDNQYTLYLGETINVK